MLIDAVARRSHAGQVKLAITGSNLTGVDNGRGAYEGTGIGLALCRQIAERHGGHITATGVPGQGATLRVTLPLRQPGAQGDETP